MTQDRPETDELIKVGMCIGQFVMASIMADGFYMTPSGAERMKELASEDINQLTGMPAEDFANLIDQQLESMKERIREINDENPKKY